MYRWTRLVTCSAHHPIAVGQTAVRSLYCGLCLMLVLLLYGFSIHLKDKQVGVEKVISLLCIPGS